MKQIKFRKELCSYATLMLLTLLSLALLLFGCRKDNPVADPWNSLPQATQNGANTMGFYANGELFVTIGQPDSWPGYNNHVKYYGSNQAGTQLRFLVGVKRSEWNLKLKLPDSVLINTNQYQLGSAWPIGGTLFLSNSGGTSPNQFNEYKTSEEHKLVVTYTRYEVPDAVGDICAGTFSGEMINANGDVLTITEGRFDISVPEY